MVRKAVFPVAGLGTRFLPATKAMPKELLPIIDKPIIQYAVEEAIEARITDPVFVTGRTKRAIEDHFDANPELERELQSNKKHELVECPTSIVPIHVKCIFVRQPQALGLGHAVLCAEPVVGNEPFAVLLADDVVKAERNPTGDLIKTYEKTGATQLSVMKVSLNETEKYGMIVEGDDPGSVRGLVEKPSSKETPSLMASLGRYVLEPGIFDLLRDQTAGAGNEIQLADAIDRQAKLGRVRSVKLAGKRFDCGSKFGYLEAIVDFASSHPVYGEDFRSLIKARVSRF